MLKRKYSDTQLIEAIRSGGKAREKAWEYIYKEWRNQIVWIIVKKGGTKDEALEAWHEVYEDFEKRIRQPDFAIQGKLFSYWTQCVYHRFLKRKKNGDWVELEEKKTGETLPGVETEIFTSELKKAVLDSLSKIGERCKTLLLLFYVDGLSMKDIAKKMGFRGGQQVAKNEKLKCQGRYESLLKSHPHILQHLKELRNA